MDISLASYRNRIGIFNSSRHLTNNKIKKQPYKTTTRTRAGLGKLVLYMLIVVLIFLAFGQALNSGNNYLETHLYSTSPLYSTKLAAQVGAQVPALYLSHLLEELPTPHEPPVLLYQVPGDLLHLLEELLAPSELPAVLYLLHQAGHQAGGWILVALPLQQGIYNPGFITTTPQNSFFSLDDSNFYARYTYGNRTSRGIKLGHWNAGSAHLENKTSEIETLISNYSPHLLGISEANLHKNHCIDNCRIADYDLITCSTMDNEALQVSRVVVYKHTSLVAKVREDLMSDKFSSIWLEVGFPGRTKILVCNVYREWQYLGQSDSSSLDISEQLARWILFLEQWEKALNTGKECIVMGDFNLDFLSFNRSDLPSSSQAYRMKPLVQELFDRVVPQGVKQCVVGATRQGAAGQADSGLDHVWTNTPGKLSQIYTSFNGSDHKILFGVRYSKMIRSSIRYVKKRSYKKFDETKFLEKIRVLSWWDIYQSEDVNEAVHLLTTRLNFILDNMAPVKTFQTNSKYCPWLSEGTKLLIQMRNRAQDHVSENKTEENINKFKRLRNKVTNSLKNDKIKWQKQKLEKCNNDSGKLWKNILGWLNWCSSGSPTKLYHEGHIVTAPTKLAEIMNNFLEAIASLEVMFSLSQSLSQSLTNFFSNINLNHTFLLPNVCPMFATCLHIKYLMD